MTDFAPDVAQAVLAHMNDDHLEDNLTIVRAHGAPEAIAASMVGVDPDAGTWELIGPEGPIGDLRIEWPDGPISACDEIRREVVALFRASTDSTE